jgi:cytochrome c
MIECIGLAAARAALAAMLAGNAVSASGAELKLGDPDRGEKVFLQCAACHAVEKGAEARIGPNLWDVVERDIASAPGFAYSDAMKAQEGSWTLDRLDRYLANPQGSVPGTIMGFPGIASDGRRQDLLAYLVRNSPGSSVAAGLPSAGARAGQSAVTTALEPGAYGVLVAKPGVEETYGYCTSCHSERIVAQQGLTREGWDELLDWMIDEQGMAPIPAPDRSRVLEYLSAHYGTDRPNFPN